MYAHYRIRQLQEPVLLFGKLFSHNQLCIAVSIAGIPILYLFGVGNIMFWVVGEFDEKIKLTASFTRVWQTNWELFSSSSSYPNLGASTLIVALHAVFYNIDAIVTEEFEAFLAESETV